MDQFRLNAVADKWQWVWRYWRSLTYDELEERPWTPFVLNGELCFTARENGKWFVVVGHSNGKKYDDVFDTVEYQSKPLYVARENSEWLLVLGNNESQRFTQQINFKIHNGEVLIKLYISAENSVQLVKPFWTEN